MNAITGKKQFHATRTDRPPEPLQDQGLDIDLIINDKNVRHALIQNEIAPLVATCVETHYISKKITINFLKNHKQPIELLPGMQARLLPAETHVTDFITVTDRVSVRFQAPRPTGRPRAPAPGKDVVVDPSIMIRNTGAGGWSGNRRTGRGAESVLQRALKIGEMTANCASMPRL